LSVQLILMMTFLFILLAFLHSHVFWPRAPRGALSCNVVSSATSTLAVWAVARGRATVRALARHCLMLAEHWQQSEHWQDTGRVLAMLEPKWIWYIYRRLGVYSDREILMVPGCVILSLGFLLSLVLRCPALRALWVWCSTLFCEIK